jgi:hypothetical protein
MAIVSALNLSLLFKGDGSSTTLVIDLDDGPVSFTTEVQPNFSFRGFHPSSIVPVSIDGSTTNLPSASLAGTVATFTFPSAPASIVSNLAFEALF